MRSASIKRRSVYFDGRKRSVSLEDEFWDALREIAEGRGVSVSELVRGINADRNGALSSAIRLFVLEAYKDQIERPQPKRDEIKLVG